MHPGLLRVLAAVAVGLAGPATTATAAPAAPDAGTLQVDAAADLCARVGSNAGFTGDRLVTAVAVALAESRCNPAATLVNTDGSRDRGLWQINSRWHPEVSDDCAYDAQCNADAAFRISGQGTSWTPWVTFNTGAYRSWLDEARAAVDRLDTGPDSVVWRQSNYTASSGGTSFGWGGQPRTRCTPITGDWDGNGTTTAGLACYTDTGWTWYRTNTNGSSGSQSFGWGGTARAFCAPITGDWNGDGTTTIGLACPESGGWTWYRTNTNGPSSSQSFGWGAATATTTYPITGDWNGDGTTTVGLATHTSNGWRWQQTNFNAPSGESANFGWGAATLTTAIPITGDWNGDGTTTVGLATHTSGGWIWRHTNFNTSSGGWNYGWGGGTLSPQYHSPITGDWNADGTTSIGIASAKRR